MKLIEQSYKILTDLSPESVKKMKEFIEFSGRLCYKTEDKTGMNTDEFLSKLWNQYHHESIFEHATVSVHLITNRGVTHELVRHRIVSYSQESTRYCNYSKGKFGEELTYIKPVWLNPNNLFVNKDNPEEIIGGVLNSPENSFLLGLKQIEECYLELVDTSCDEYWKAEQAREILPNALASSITMTTNWREWKHIFKMRCAENAHPQIRSLMRAVEQDFHDKIGVPF